MVGWIARYLAWRKRNVFPESRWTVMADADGLAATDHTGTVARADFATLEAVVIETDDRGPFACDLWWYLYGPGGGLASAFPQGATGYSEGVAAVTALPEFDHEEMLRAMGSTAPAAFVVWKRAVAGEAGAD